MFINDCVNLKNNLNKKEKVNKILSVLITIMAFATVAIAAEKPTAGLVLVGPKRRWWLEHETLSRNG